RDAELQRLDPGVAGDVEVAVRLAAGLAAVQGEGQSAAAGGKVRRLRLDAVPDDVRLHVAGRSTAAKELAAAQGRMPSPQRDQRAREAQKVRPRVGQAPVDPTDLI